MALTLFSVVLSLTILSTMGGLLVGDPLAWRHGAKYVLLSFHLEDVVVRSAIVDDTSIKLPWSSEKKVANGHWNDITLQGVLISANFEGDLYSMLDLDSAGVAKPLNFVGMWVLRLGNWSLEQSSSLSKL